MYPSPLGGFGVGREEADERVRRRIQRRRVERRERDRQQAGAQVQARVDVDIDAERGRGIDPRAVRRQARRHVDDVAAEPDRAELERAPVEVRAELLGDDDVVRGDLGGLLVGEFDRVGHRSAGSEVSRGAVAGGAEEVVGVMRGLIVARGRLGARRTGGVGGWGWLGGGGDAVAVRRDGIVAGIVESQRLAVPAGHAKRERRGQPQQFGNRASLSTVLPARRGFSISSRQSVLASVPGDLGRPDCD